MLLHQDRLRSLLVFALLHVKEYLKDDGGTVILSNGHKIEVARRKKDMFLGKMKQYYKY